MLVWIPAAQRHLKNVHCLSLTDDLAIVLYAYIVTFFTGFSVTEEAPLVTPVRDCDIEQLGSVRGPKRFGMARILNSGEKARIRIEDSGVIVLGKAFYNE